MSYEGMIAETVLIKGHEGDMIDAPGTSAGRGSVRQRRADSPHARLG